MQSNPKQIWVFRPSTHEGVPEKDDDLAAGTARGERAESSQGTGEMLF